MNKKGWEDLDGHFKHQSSALKVRDEEGRNAWPDESYSCQQVAFVSEPLDIKGAFTVYL